MFPYNTETGFTCCNQFSNNYCNVSNWDQILRKNVFNLFSENNKRLCSLLCHIKWIQHLSTRVPSLCYFSFTATRQRNTAREFYSNHFNFGRFPLNLINSNCLNLILALDTHFSTVLHRGKTVDYGLHDFYCNDLFMAHVSTGSANNMTNLFLCSYRYLTAALRHLREEGSK